VGGDRQGHVADSGVDGEVANLAAELAEIAEPAFLKTERSLRSLRAPRL